MLQIYKKKIIYARNYCVFFLKRRQNPKKHIPFFAVGTKNGGSERSALQNRNFRFVLKNINNFLGFQKEMIIFATDLW